MTSSPAAQPCPDFLPLLAERFARQRLAHWPRSKARHNDGKPTVLFLCTHNAGRSQMAMGFFTHLAGDAAVAWSGGSEPGTKSTRRRSQAMAERGIDIPGEYPKPWTDEIVQAADVIITMGCGDACPIFPGRRYEEWVLDDPAGQDVAPFAPSATRSSVGSERYSLNSKFRLVRNALRAINLQPPHAVNTGTDSKASVRKLLRSTVDWLRAGYPDEAPNTGYCPLIALNGPAPLTPKQKRRTLGEVDQDTASATEISIAITKVTGSTAYARPNECDSTIAASAEATPPVVLSSDGYAMRPRRSSTRAAISSRTRLMRSMPSIPRSSF